MRGRVKEFEIPLDEDFYLAVKIESVAGQITAFVVRLMRMGEPDVNVARYDTAHKLPHRDVLGRTKGLLRKDWMTGMPLKEALTHAISDLRANYERYAQVYEEN